MTGLLHHARGHDRDICATEARQIGSAGELVAEPRVCFLDAVTQPNARTPAEGLQTVDVEELLRRTVRLRRVKQDLAPKTDHIGDESGEVGNRDIGTYARSGRCWPPSGAAGRSRRRRRSRPRGDLQTWRVSSGQLRGDMHGMAALPSVPAAEQPHLSRHAALSHRKLVRHVDIGRISYRRTQSPLNPPLSSPTCAGPTGDVGEKVPVAGGAACQIEARLGDGPCRFAQAFLAVGILNRP